MTDKLYLRIPAAVQGFGLRELASWALDNSPLITTRSRMRLLYQALDAIEAASKDGSHGIAEISREVGEFLAAAVDAAPLPPAELIELAADGKPVPNGYRIKLAPTVFNQLFAAIESMSDKRPEPETLPHAQAVLDAPTSRPAPALVA